MCKRSVLSALASQVCAGWQQPTTGPACLSVTACRWSGESGRYMMRPTQLCSEPGGPAVAGAAGNQIIQRMSALASQQMLPWGQGGQGGATTCSASGLATHGLCTASYPLPHLRRGSCARCCPPSSAARWGRGLPRCAPQPAAAGASCKLSRCIGWLGRTSSGARASAPLATSIQPWPLFPPAIRLVCSSRGECRL